MRIGIPVCFFEKGKGNKYVSQHFSVMYMKFKLTRALHREYKHMYKHNISNKDYKGGNQRSISTPDTRKIHKHKHVILIRTRAVKDLAEHHECLIGGGGGNIL